MSVDDVRLEAQLPHGDGGRFWSQVVPLVVSLVVLLGVWQALTGWDVVAPIILPAPADVGRAIVDFADPLSEATAITLVEVLLGFGVAVLFSFVMALPISYSKRMRTALYPPLVMLHAVPKAAIAPILLIWFGFGLTHKVVVSFLVAFFPIVIALSAGLRRVDPDLHDLSRSLHASWLQTFWKIDLPFALPMLFSGLRVAITLAVVGAVIAEFVAGDGGLAHLLRSAGTHNQTALSFACAIILSLMSMVLFGAIALLEHLTVPWARRPN